MSINIYDYFNNTISKDLFDLVCGDKLGEGSTRQVYRFIPDPTYTLKIETAACRFQNIIEWDVWERVKWTKHKDWFAPCKFISPCGTILIQQYARNAETADELSDHVPVYFTDIKSENFGIINNRTVCRDYGNNLLIERGLTSRLKKAEW